MPEALPALPGGARDGVDGSQREIGNFGTAGGGGGLGSVEYPVWVLAEPVGGVWRGEVQVDHAAIRFEASLVESL